MAGREWRIGAVLPIAFSTKQQSMKHALAIMEKRKQLTELSRMLYN
jgi:hypothetical protein